jgi:hypothetical protein
VLFNREVQNQLWQKPCEEAETDSPANFGKETVAGARRRSKWAPHYSAQANLGRAQDAQALPRLCPGSAQACSPSAQVKAAAAQVRRLKRNSERKN